MVNEGNHGGGSDTIAAARSRVRNGAVPDWVKENSFAADFKPEGESQVTYLLFDTQIDAERHEAFIHQAIRLETMQAVQHWSQWRLQFEPKTQLITLHSLKIRRGDVEIDQSNLEKSHLLQREEGLDRFVIMGWFTILMVLDDVRAGDILEFSYTIETQPRLFPELGGYFFTLPQDASVGKYHFAVRFNNARQRKWKSSVANLIPVESQENGITFWEWSGEKHDGLKPEINTPLWHISYLWIQVSDFSDWQTIAAELSKAWTVENTDETVAEVAREIESKEPDLTSRIEKAIQLVQDDCRYLSVNLELGGHIPTPPGVVARRRFGDCKDLSFLLANLLKKLGVEAKPVLVNTFLRKSVADFLPMPSLFNHVVVEFEADGKTRWIDTTFKEQGGGPFNRIIPDYALGLPIDASATGLIKQPQISGQSNLFDLREHILLDTSSTPSLMDVTVRAEGNQAELLRQQLKKSGMEEWAKQRLQGIVNRFRDGKRIDSLKYRDDRAANKFILTEVFEINFLLGAHTNPKLCRFNLPGNIMSGVLALPQKGERHTPFALPYPCQINYAADVDCLAIQRIKLNEPRVDLSNPYVRYNRDSKTGHGYFVMKLSLVTNADSVPAKQVQKHGELVEQIARASCRELSLMRGYSRSRPKSGFGELPAISDGINPPPLPFRATFQKTDSTESPTRRHDRQGARYKIPWRLAWIIFVIVMWILFSVLKNSSH
jgi:hypothetical protein